MQALHNDICKIILELNPSLGNCHLLFYSKCLEALESSIGNNKEIKKIFDKQLENFIECANKKNFKKKNLLLLKLADNLDSLDESETLAIQSRCSEIKKAFESFIRSHPRSKLNLKNKLQPWLYNICTFLNYEQIELEDYPDSNNINFYEFFQQGLTLEELVERTKLSPKRIEQKAKEYNAFLYDDNIYRITDICHQPKLSLNTTEIGCLLLSLCTSYYLEENSKIRKSPPKQILRIALNIWSLISIGTRHRLKEKYGLNKHYKMHDFYTLLDKCVDLHNPEFLSEAKQAEQRKSEMFERLSFAFKAAKPMYLKYSDEEDNNKIKIAEHCYISEDIFSNDRTGVGVALTKEDKSNGNYIFIKYKNIVEAL